MASNRKLTQAEMFDELEDRFGPDPANWAFRCPHCGDTATGRDFAEAIAAHPRLAAGGPLTAPGVLGQECIGRTLGALAQTGTGYTGRGCKWAAYGRVPGPWEVVMPDGHSAWSFEPAPAPAPVLLCAAETARG